LETAPGLSYECCLAENNRELHKFLRLFRDILTGNPQLFLMKFELKGENETEIEYPANFIFISFNKPWLCFFCNLHINKKQYSHCETQSLIQVICRWRRMRN
jgi:hypothetical protein